jgi:hypothetical protein
VAPDEFQFFPAIVDGYPGKYSIVNFTQLRKCIDELQSEFIKWTKDDHRADKAGEYRQVTRLVIDPALVGDTHIFRPWGWKVVLIVSERIRELFVRHRITGVTFLPVC